VQTRASGDATALAREAAGRGVALVVSVGGDGTVNEVVNGITDPAGGPRAALGAILTGRGRDAARTLGVPRDPLRAAARLAAGRERRLDLGVVRRPEGSRYFVNAAGAGFDATVAARAAALEGGGTIPYLRAVAGSLGAYRPVSLAVGVDGPAGRPAPAAGVVVANGTCFGGGMRIAPGADPRDGALDVVVLGALGRWELLRWLPTLYWGGHVRNPKVTIARARRVALESPETVPMQLDGEPWGGTPCEIAACPDALTLFG
jgi:YegS/Rv2252/BmrU family lipid kinase